jgi:hypothetical protein
VGAAAPDRDPLARAINHAAQAKPVLIADTRMDLQNMSDEIAVARRSARYPPVLPLPGGAERPHFASLNMDKRRVVRGIRLDRTNAVCRRFGTSRGCRIRKCGRHDGVLLKRFIRKTA